ncbi:MAG: membrane-bound lytic murein transglycosylase MltF [Pseudomonadota bacterium]
MGNSPSRLNIAFACLLLLLSACSERLPPWQQGKLIAIVPEPSLGAESEFERELVRLFGEHLHTAVEFIPSPRSNTLPALSKQRGHLAAAALPSEINVSALQFGPSYQTVREQVICNRDRKLPQNINDLAQNQLTVVAGSPQEIILREIRKQAPSLQWQARPHLTIQGLLEEVSQGTVSCAVANELQFSNARNFFPNLAAAFNIGTPAKLAWALPQDADPVLIKEVFEFFTRIRKDGTLSRLLDHYYGHSIHFKSVDAATFVSRVETVLPSYRHLFEEASSATDEDWRLLAALAYQESHWDPLATSFTNVRGMMMLTEDTADQMKVGNRLDARESIMAGAQYLKLIKGQLSERIAEPDRTWMALAAYNQGRGHLEDARVLTQRNGGNPDAWADVKKWMPLLNQAGYYETLKYGYARGGEAVILVENIRGYYNMLRKMEPETVPATSFSFSYSLAEPIKRLFKNRH